jgi:hypothetical protein
MTPRRTQEAARQLNQQLDRGVLNKAIPPEGGWVSKLRATGAANSGP